MASSMYIDCEKLKELAIRLNRKINDIENCYSEISKNAGQIVGTNDIWKGNNQVQFSNYLVSLADRFPDNLDKLKEFYSFLINTIKEYERRESDINNDINSNIDKFDV